MQTRSNFSASHTNSSNIPSGSTVAEGAVPVKTLNLPDEYQWDGWGRKFSYAVWTPLTTAATSTTSPAGFLTYGVSPNCGGITVENAGHGYRSTGAAYALISYGSNGHGGYLKNGNPQSTRYFMSSDNTDEWTDCHCNASADTGYKATYVQEDPTQTSSADSLSVYDDIVRFKERWQMQDAYDAYNPSGAACAAGFRINGNVANGNLGYYGSVAVGDVNGDGIPDLVIGSGGTSPNNVVYVIFGTTTGFPNPLSVGAPNGSNGYTLTSYFNIGISVAVGDIDHDGVADIIMPTGWWNNGGGQVNVWYGQKYGGKWPTACSPSYDLDTATSCQGFVIYNSQSMGRGGSVNATPSVAAVGDVNGDGITDLIIGDGLNNLSEGANAVYVIFGKNKTCPATPTFPATIDVSTLSSASTPAGTIIHDNDANKHFWAESLTVGDINGDGYADIIVSDSFYPPGSYNGKLYVIAGQPAAHWPSSIYTASLAGIPAGGGGSCPSPYNTCGFTIYNDAVGGAFFGNSVATGDVTGDGIADIAVGSNNNITGGAGYAWVVKGASGAWSANNNLSALLSGGKALQFTNFTSNTLGPSVAVGDVNGDGKPDLMISDPGNGTTPSPYGSVYVLFGPLSAGLALDTSPPNGTNGLRVDCSYSDNDNGGSINSCLPGGAGDINGDGIGDLIIAVSGGNAGDYSGHTGNGQEGYVYVVFGKKSGWTSPYQLNNIY